MKTLQTLGRTESTITKYLKYILGAILIIIGIGLLIHGITMKPTPPTTDPTPPTTAPNYDMKIFGKEESPKNGMMIIGGVLIGVGFLTIIFAYFWDRLVQSSPTVAGLEGAGDTMRIASKVF